MDSSSNPFVGQELDEGLFDGGLLHKFTWAKSSTYAEVCTLYVRHVSSSYVNATVGFNGCHGPRAKDKAHRYRASNDVCFNSVCHERNVPDDVQESLHWECLHLPHLHPGRRNSLSWNPC